MGSPVAVSGLRLLGRTGLEVSPVSLGASTLGQDRPLGEPPSEHAAETARTMLTGPFRLVDSSNSYGQGRSEAALGAGLAALGGHLPDGVVLATKADCDLTTGRFDHDRVLRSFEESTRRVGVDHFPLYHLHDPYTVSFADTMGPQGAVAALVRLRDEGAVGHLGIAAGPLSLVDAYVRTGVFDVVLTHNRYTLLNRSAAELISAWSERGLGVLNGAAFGGGLLARGSRPGATYAYEPAPAEVLAFVERLDAVCREWDVPMPAAALQFSLRNPAISTTLVGTAVPARVEQTRVLAERVIPDGFWDAVDELGTPPVDFGED
ncbi:aldo/keto reductase [Microlunatus flavus]|uniref:D-threo-aldose 1-dehydrogenase n=1 Tax=Microlunatus flavus TaxID=1036181 RepID=A0A1H9KAM4_9ACTN|nr:aldo/keto reductase [Microlunatus flavus]SEQ96181.1 D-threo-aldose 1-dehydrogenase [Microlunatus flavus]